MLTYRQQIGSTAEELAARFLAGQGVRILVRNFRRRRGELDIVALQNDVLIIAEVRTRANSTYGGASASVTPRKQRCIQRATAQLLQRRKELARLRVRFDVIVVREVATATPCIEWIQHAFTA